MTALPQPQNISLPWCWREHAAAYYELCKPKVVMLMLITAIVGMCLATPTLVPFTLLLSATVGIGLAAASAAVINHVVDQRIDIIMARTHRRPIPTGKINTLNALIFAGILASIGLGILWFFVNPVTTYLTFFTLIGYAVIYTMFLKRATPQNIVVGGLAGAAPPLLGWTAVSGHITADSLLLVLIIYTWTPPHFWALAIYRLEDYARAEIPMLPVTHGVRYTKINIVLYTLLLIACSLLPFVTGMSSWIYLVGSTLLGMRFLWWTIKLWRTDVPKVALQTFWFSIYYLFILFIVLLVDHYWAGILSLFLGHHA